MADEKNDPERLEAAPSLVVAEPVQEVEEVEEVEHAPGVAPGQWYWLTDDDEYVDEDEDGDQDGDQDGDGPEAVRHLVCVVGLGSNHVRVESVTHRWRIHNDNWLDRTQYEPNPEAYLDAKAAEYRDEAKGLMAQIHEVTSRLGISPQAALSAASETQALAVRGDGDEVGAYKAALVRAKEDELPELFRALQRAHKNMAAWMTAKVMPYKAMSGDMRQLVDKVDDRIFSISIYAGLVEEVRRIRKGKPADFNEKLRVMQRRCYMDEECLAHYELGGMDYAGIKEFDEWLAKPVNRDRLLPFPRCMVAFRVRRHRKYRKGYSLGDFLHIQQQERADKVTYLYLRNGTSLYRLNTDLELDEKLFPDFDRSQLDEGLWARDIWPGQPVEMKDLITDREYQEILEREAAGKKDHWRQSSRYTRFDPSSVYYDEIAAGIEKQVKYYNRVALLIQGLFDRSEVFHPHPPVKTWDAAGFDRAVELIYDRDRALHPADMPDLDAYFAELAAQIDVGSVTIGQYGIWEARELAKDRRRNGWRAHNYHPATPWNDPGPKKMDVVQACSPRARKCRFEWARRRVKDPGWGESVEIPTQISVPRAKLFNVSAYKPGDFRQFFADPRTRERYLEWAPLLLAAEEYHAGNIDPDTGEMRSRAWRRARDRLAKNQKKTKKKKASRKK